MEYFEQGFYQKYLINQFSILNEQHVRINIISGYGNGFTHIK